MSLNDVDDWLELREKRHKLALEKNYEFSSDYGFYDPIMCGSIDGTDEKAHDRSIIRAIYSRYEPNLAVKSDPERTLFIGRLNFKTSEDELTKTFAKYGEIKSLRLVRDVVTGCSKGYAFVEYKHRSDAKYAHKKAFKIVMDDRELVVEYEHERTLKGWRPRRLGGGFGGYKESGQMKFGGRYKPFEKIYRSYHQNHNQRHYSFKN
jgi:U11/U12 small nuclear ribonucleoprotein SNRNP35